MEEEKKDNKKAGMRRALNVRDILNKKYDVFPFEGKWKDAFDTPEVRGCWFVWGNSGNGKTSFVMQLCKELCKYDRVAFNSLEEGTSLTVQNNLRRFGMAEVSRHLAFIKEDIPTLKIRLRRHKSFNIVIIDSFQYTQMTYRDYIQLKEEFPDKLFVFISHARGKNPKGVKEHGTNSFARNTETNPFAAKIVCGECNKVFQRKGWRSSAGDRKVWQCSERYKVKGVMGCSNRHIDEETVREIYIMAWNRLLECRDMPLAWGILLT